MLRRFSGLLCSKCCFCSLIFAFIISLGCINTANAYVCFLPDSSDCAKGDTEGFWPCAGSDCDGGENGKCNASYNSNRSTNECGATCTRCSDSTSPYNGLYKCPENTCNCNEYTSAEAFNECGESCKVCRIAGDKNYGKYKCPAVPAEGCANPQCEDYTLTAEDECKDCDQCTNKNAPAEKQGLWKCTDCDQDIYNQPIARLTSAEILNHCYENETCGCYMKCDNCFGKDLTMQDCQNSGYNSAKNECNGKRGTVYETCCNTCNGYMYPTDLGKTSEGWSCTPCPNSCADGGTKYSCGCKTGYHTEGGNCVLNQCTSGVAENTCGTGYTFTPNGTSFKDTNGNTVRCGNCEENVDFADCCPINYDGGIDAKADEVYFSSLADCESDAVNCGIDSSNATVGGTCVIGTRKKTFRVRHHPSIYEGQHYMEENGHMVFDAYIDNITDGLREVDLSSGVPNTTDGYMVSYDDIYPATCNTDAKYAKSLSLTKDVTYKYTIIFPANEAKEYLGCNRTGNQREITFLIRRGNEYYNEGDCGITDGNFKITCSMDTHAFNGSNYDAQGKVVSIEFDRTEDIDMEVGPYSASECTNGYMWYLRSKSDCGPGNWIFDSYTRTDGQTCGKCTRALSSCVAP